MAPYYVYIVRCADGTLYTGVTTDLARRVEEHNSGRGAKYTRGRRPVRLAFSEPAESRGRALEREAEIKKLGRSDKLALLASAPAAGQSFR
ncbi:MAG: GIY-YIG nuclease family protein [Nitrososphaerota archaeon]|nr:GIY-YIG nuclease family protein [Nitrososphaerota archaeon]